jgi:flagellar motor switch protein FliG
MPKAKTGIPSVLEMLQLLDPAARAKILSNVAAQDPELARTLELNLFAFEDIAFLSARHTQELLKELPQPLLLLALRGSSDALKQHLFANMSKRAADELKSLIEAQTPQKLSEVHKAQAEVIEIARRLESEGRLLLKKED